MEIQSCVAGRREEERKGKEEEKRESVVLVVEKQGEKIRLSSPSQSQANTWQSEISFILNAQTFINYIRTLLF
jgi:hypothetical protein